MATGPPPLSPFTAPSDIPNPPTCWFQAQHRDVGCIQHHGDCATELASSQAGVAAGSQNVHKGDGNAGTVPEG